MHRQRPRDCVRSLEKQFHHKIPHLTKWPGTLLPSLTFSEWISTPRFPEEDSKTCWLCHLALSGHFDSLVNVTRYLCFFYWMKTIVDDFQSWDNNEVIVLVESLYVLLFACFLIVPPLLNGLPLYVFHFFREACKNATHHHLPFILKMYPIQFNCTLCAFTFWR